MIIVEFERIGRYAHGKTIELDMETSSEEFGDDIADEVHRESKKYLTSPWFDIQVYGNGTGVIEAGRFGRFTWKEVTE